MSRSHGDTTPPLPTEKGKQGLSSSTASQVEVVDSSRSSIRATVKVSFLDSFYLEVLTVFFFWFHSITGRRATLCRPHG